MFPSINSVIKKLKKTKSIVWNRSKYLSNGVYKAVFDNPMAIEEFYLANMEFFNDQKVNTKCIQNVLLIYKKKQKEK